VRMRKQKRCRIDPQTGFPRVGIGSSRYPDEFAALRAAWGEGRGRAAASEVVNFC